MRSLQLSAALSCSFFAWAWATAPGPGYGAPQCCATAGNWTTFTGPSITHNSRKIMLDELKQWRKDTIAKYNLTFDAYEDPDVNWTRTSYVQPQVHLFDRYLYDDVTHKFTVGRYLADLKERYGGIDSVLIWPTYPNIGIDARNQFDLFRAVPGGLEAVKALTDDFHKEGVRVLWGYHPFDQSLRDEGEPHWKTLARLLKETGGDGFNGDTMNTMYKEFWDAGVEIGHKIVGEMEGGGYPSSVGWAADNSWESTNWNTMGWGYFFENREDGLTETYAMEPPIDRAKWLDPRGRRMTHVNDRWSNDRRNPMQIAHFNGVGYESWENVWGIFMTFTERDGEALKRLQTVWKWLGRFEFIQNYKEWVPYATEVMGAHGVYASRFLHMDGHCAWTVVNRDIGDAVFDLDLAEPKHAGCKGSKLYDLFSGVELKDGLQLALEGYGYGAYVLIDEKALVGWDLVSVLNEMKHRTHNRPLSSFSTAWAPLRQTMVPQESKPALKNPKGMALIPRTKYLFQTAGVEIEGGCDVDQDTFGAGVCCSTGVQCPSKDALCKDMCAFGGADTRGVDVQFPWETTPRRFHSKTLDVGPFYIDQNLVTNKEFSEFVLASGYKPQQTHNFMRDFSNKTGQDHKPATWVSLKEARAYCKAAGKRLPHVWEWQLAAQGNDGRSFPWGNELDHTRFPKPSSGPEVPELPDVGSFPAGNSPYNVSDMFGLVWQFTDEFRDVHTKGALLKGSSMFNPVLGGDFPSLPQPGNWYFPPARKLTRHNRLLLFDDSYERAATLGFRCVASHPDGGDGVYHLHGNGAEEVYV